MSDLVEEVNDGNFESWATLVGAEGELWQLIFQQSKVNNGAYNGDRLPAQNRH